jgi:hypothetical protein
VQQLVRAGATECPEWPLDRSVEMARLMDSIRCQLGVIYPKHDGLLMRVRALLGVWPRSARIITAFAIMSILALARGKRVSR